MTKSGSAAGFGGHAPAQRGPATSERVAATVTTALSREQVVAAGLGAALDWRPFLRALAAEIDVVAGSEGRDALLHGVGLQLARMYPLPVRESLDGLAMEMTETLDGFGWGSVGIAFSDREKCLLLTHQGLPRIGGAGDPPGTWLAGVLVGLYAGWMSQQPGTDASLVARRVASAQPDEIAIRYGKE